MLDNDPVGRILSLYERYGQEHYGEAVTQIQHAVQAGALAIAEGYPDDVVLAAFLHDIGHLMIKEVSPDERDDAIYRHQRVGAERLRDLGFSEQVVDLVATHVDSKRYLMAIDTGYLSTLSPASMESLGFQGGPMTADEVAAFEARPDLYLHVRLRHWDDLAKDPDNDRIDISPFVSRMREHLRLRRSALDDLSIAGNAYVSGEV